MSKFSAKQIEAIRLLSEGLTIAQVAAELKISERTIYRWQKVPGFMELASQIQSEALDKVVEKTSEEISERMKAMLPDALDVLHEFILSEEKRGSDRLAAIRILGQWSGIGNAQQSKEPEPQISLKDYLSVLSNSNGQSAH